MNTLLLIFGVLAVFSLVVRRVKNLWTLSALLIGCLALLGVIGGGGVGEFLPFLGVAIVAVPLLLPFTIKNNLLKSLEQTPTPATPDEFPLLDSAALQNLTAEWENLGFAHLADWKTGGKHKNLATVFSRVMENRELGVLVDLNQAFAPNRKVRPFSSALACSWGERADWERELHNFAPAPLADPHFRRRAPQIPHFFYAVGNRAPHWIYNTLRHEKILGSRATNAAPATLLALFLDRRAALERVLGPAARDELAARHDLTLRVLRAVWLDSLQRRPAWPLIWKAWRKSTTQVEIFGPLTDQIGPLKPLDSF